MPQYKCSEGIRMDKYPGKTNEKKSGPVSPRLIIDEVIQSIESVDRQIEEFFAIHGKDLQISLDKRRNDRRGQ